MSSYERGRSMSRSPPPRSRTPPPEEYPSRPGSGRSPRTPEGDKYKSRMSRSGSRGRSGSPRSPRSGDGRRTPPGSSPRMRSRSPRDRSRSYERSRPRYYDGSPPPRRGGGGGRDREREAPEPNKCLGIFGLSLYTTERELEKHFGQFGNIDKCQVVLDGHSGRSRGFAFIYYETVDDAAEARKEMDGKELDGKPIRVDFSITKRPHTPTPGMYMGRPSRDFRRGGRGGDRGGYRGGRGGGYRDSRPSYDRYGGGGDRYRDDRRDRGYDRYDDRDRDRYYDDRDRYERRDDRDRYHDRRGGPSHGGYPEDRRYDSYPPAPPSGYGKRPRPRSPSPYERDSRPRREYRSRSREYDRRY